MLQVVHSHSVRIQKGFNVAKTVTYEATLKISAESQFGQKQLGPISIRPIQFGQNLTWANLSSANYNSANLNSAKISIRPISIRPISFGTNMVLFSFILIIQLAPSALAVL